MPAMSVCTPAFAVPLTASRASCNQMETPISVLAPAQLELPGAVARKGVTLPMHAERSDSPPVDVPSELEAVVMMVLLAGDHVLWSGGARA
jgi:hypothetical protein